MLILSTFEHFSGTSLTERRDYGRHFRLKSTDFSRKWVTFWPKVVISELSGPRVPETRGKVTEVAGSSKVLKKC